MRALTASLMLFGLLACGPDRSHPSRLSRPHWGGGPHQTWVEGCSLLALPGPWGPSEPMSGPVLLDGRSGRTLEAPAALVGLQWWSWIRQPLQMGRDTWVAGIPAHPGWYLLEAHTQEGKPTYVARKGNPQLPQYQLPKAEARLFRSRDFGPWELVARFRPQTPKGSIQVLIPLADGSFLGMGSFREGQAWSPLVRVQRGSDGWLQAGALVPGAGGETDGMGRVIWTPQGVVVLGKSVVLVLDARDGRVLHRLCLPEGLAVLDAQGAPDGTVRMRAFLPRPQGLRTKAGEPETPAEAWLTQRFFNLHRGTGARPRLQWLTLDPGRGELRLLGETMAWVDGLGHPGFTVDPDGRPRLLPDAASW